MDWGSVDGGATIGQPGSESGVIVRDAEHPLGARITLERGGVIAPWSITCGIYGSMAHTRFFATEQEASEQFDLMASVLAAMLHSRDSGDGGIVAAIGRFVERFP